MARSITLYLAPICVDLLTAHNLTLLQRAAGHGGQSRTRLSVDLVSGGLHVGWTDVYQQRAEYKRLGAWPSPEVKLLKANSRKAMLLK